MRGRLSFGRGRQTRHRQVAMRTHIRVAVDTTAVPMKDSAIEHRAKARTVADLLCIRVGCALRRPSPSRAPGSVPYERPCTLRA